MPSPTSAATSPIVLSPLVGMLIATPTPTARPTAVPPTGRIEPTRAPAPAAAATCDPVRTERSRRRVIAVHLRKVPGFVHGIVCRLSRTHCCRSSRPRERRGRVLLRVRERTCRCGSAGCVSVSRAVMWWRRGVSSLFSSLGCFALLFHGEGFEGSHGVGVVAWDTGLYGSAIPAGEKKPGKPEEKAKQGG